MNQLCEDTILVIGSANAENVLDLKSDLIIGQKHYVIREELLGGSGLNYTLRLINYDGTSVLPILSVGKDAIGTSIQQHILHAVQVRGVSQTVADFVKGDDFFCSGIFTAQSTIVVTRELRTIFREELVGAEDFGRFVKKRLADVRRLANDRVRAVMIGHIYAPHPDQRSGESGKLTREIIEQYRHTDAVIYTNFGESQYSLGPKFWEKTLQYVDIFQLSITEARQFFAQLGTTLSLTDMIRWFQTRGLTAVITLDKFGAIATFKGGHDGIVFAPAFDLDQFEDSTGAGDAFGAGLVSQFCTVGAEITFDCFREAIRHARLWAAHACTVRGAASRCPSASELATFEKELNRKGSRARDKGLPMMRTNSLDGFRDIFRLLDKAY